MGRIIYPICSASTPRNIDHRYDSLILINNYSISPITPFYIILGVNKGGGGSALHPLPGPCAKNAVNIRYNITKKALLVLQLEKLLHKCSSPFGEMDFAALQSKSCQNKREKEGFWL